MVVLFGILVVEVEKVKTIQETWKKFGSKIVINDPYEIKMFLEQLVKDTRGHLNTEFIDGGYADQLIKIEYNPPFFYLYWKDFSKIFDKFINGIELDENDISNLEN